MLQQITRNDNSVTQPDYNCLMCYEEVLALLYRFFPLAYLNIYCKFTKLIIAEKYLFCVLYSMLYVISVIHAIRCD